MNTALLNRRIEIQTFTTITTENGFEEPTWVPYKTVWASKQGVNGREYYAAKAVQSENDVKFTVRYSNDTKILLTKNATKLYRIKYKDMIYNFIFAKNILEQNEYIELKAAEENE